MPAVGFRLDSLHTFFRVFCYLYAVGLVHWDVWSIDVSLEKWKCASPGKRRLWRVGGCAKFCACSPGKLSIKTVIPTIIDIYFAIVALIPPQLLHNFIGPITLRGNSGILLNFTSPERNLVSNLFCVLMAIQKIAQDLGIILLNLRHFSAYIIFLCLAVNPAGFHFMGHLRRLRSH